MRTRDMRKVYRECLHIYFWLVSIKPIQVGLPLREKSVRIRSFLVRIFPPYFPSVSPYSVPMRENTDHKNSEYRHFSCSVLDWKHVGFVIRWKGMPVKSIKMIIIYVELKISSRCHVIMFLSKGLRSVWNFE